MKMVRPYMEIVALIGKFSKGMGGVFSFSDLWNLIGLNSSDRTSKVVNSLVRDEVVLKARRGLYVVKDANLWVLASRLRGDAYISQDSVLARSGLIGSLPGKSVSAVSTKNPVTIETPIGRIRFFKSQPDLMFGFERGAFGVPVADNEKAYLDLLYYHLRGRRFVVDPCTDIDLWKLDKKKVLKYLKRYKNPKFRKFVEGLIRESK